MSPKSSDKSKGREERATRKADARKRAPGPAPLAPQLPANDRQETGPAREAGRSLKRPRTQTVSVPLIRPTEDASKPVARFELYKASIETVAKRWGVHQQSSQDAQELREIIQKKPQEAQDKPSTDGPIHKDMLISDIVLNYTPTLDILMASGLHCVGCTLSVYDTLESGCSLHGMDEAAITELVRQMNEKMKAEPKEKKTEKK